MSRRELCSGQRSRLCVLRRMRVESLEKKLSRGGRRNGALQHNILRRDLLSVERLVAVVVRAKRGTGEGNTGEQASSAGIGEDFGAKRDIGFSGGIAAYRSCGSGSVATYFHLAAEDAAGGTLAHEQEHEVRGLAAELKAEAAAFEGHHGGSAPGTAHVFTAAASHDAAAVARADNEGSLQDRRQDDDTV